MGCEGSRGPPGPVGPGAAARSRLNSQARGTGAASCCRCQAPTPQCALSFLRLIRILGVVFL